ncbi:MAG: redox-regulated ATPase YchF [Bacillota bacterium]
MKLGIVGLPNVGKSTLFNAITKAGAESANYPFCTIEPNIGVVAVPDKRLNVLQEMYDSKKIVPTAIEFYDIAGLVRGASKGEGLGNKFLSHIREVAAIVHVVRCFEDENIVHVEGSIGPLRDIETINLELIFSDLEILERRMQKVQKMAKSDKAFQNELELLNLLKETLENGKSVRTLSFTEEEQELVKSLGLLSYKPIIYVANVSEEDLLEGNDNAMVQQVREHAETENAEVVVICAKIESEIADLDDDEKIEFLNDLGLEESGLYRLIKAGYKLLGLISFLTAGPQEVRAWTIVNGTKAPQAAGKIHSDIERGFIRAEVIFFDDLVAAGNIVAAKDKGLVRLEGKEYIVKDGDVILFRFNV